MDQHEAKPEAKADERERRVAELEQRMLAGWGGHLHAGTGRRFAESSVSGTAAYLTGVPAERAGPLAEPAGWAESPRCVRGMGRGPAASGG